MFLEAILFYKQPFHEGGAHGMVLEKRSAPAQSEDETGKGASAIALRK